MSPIVQDFVESFKEMEMFVEIDLGNRQIGYALTSGRSGEHGKVQFREFTSTEDGQTLHSET